MSIRKDESVRSILWPRDLEIRYAISAPTRWRWEGTGKLPKRDVHVGGVAKGWHLRTIEAAERGELDLSAA